MVRTRGIFGNDEIYEPIGRVRSRGRARGRGAVSFRASTPAFDRRRDRLASPGRQPEISSRSELREAVGRIIRYVEREYPEGSRVGVGVPAPERVQTEGFHSAAVTAPRIDEVPGLETVSTRVAESVMTVEDQKMFGRFLRMNPPRFYGTQGEDAYEFVMDMHELLSRLGIVESHGVDYTTYQMSGDAKIWWRAFVDRRPVGSPPLSWVEFHRAFLDKYVSRPIRDQRRDEFLTLEQGGLSVIEYEARFLYLARYATYLIPTEEERIRRFVHGLTPPMRESCLVLLAAGTTFQTVVSHAIRVECALTYDRDWRRGRRIRRQDSLSQQEVVDFSSRPVGQGEHLDPSVSVPPLRRFRRCYRCRASGHRVSECPEPPQDPQFQTSCIPAFSR